MEFTEAEGSLRIPAKMEERTTLSDIAREAGVSRSATARVLLGTGGEHVRVSEATRDRILKAARALRYSPNRSAQQLRGRSSRTIGVILDTINTPVMSERFFALEREASHKGYRFFVGHTHGQLDALQEYVTDFEARAVEAIFCLFDLTPDRDTRAKSCFRNFKKVAFHGRPAWAGGYCIRVDTRAAVRTCVDHLVARGRKRVALAISNSANDELMTLRKEVFEESIAAQKPKVKGFVWDADFQGITPSSDVLDHGVDFMRRQCQADAIISSSDVWATRFILQLQKAGLNVPKDVAVIGYDNLDIAKVISPALTTIDQRHETYAKSAMELLMSVAGEQVVPPSKRIITISPELIIRESS